MSVTDRTGFRGYYESGQQADESDMLTITPLPLFFPFYRIRPGRDHRKTGRWATYLALGVDQQQSV